MSSSSDPPPSPSPQNKRRRNLHGEVSPQSVLRQKLLTAALDLRLKGYTYRQIAEELTKLATAEYPVPGRPKARRTITTRQAHKMLTDYYRKNEQHNRESADQLTRLQLDRIERLFRALDRGIDRGDVRSVEAANKLLERQSKLVGLDAPVKQEVQVSHLDVPDPELLALAEQLKLMLPSSSNPLPVTGLLPGEVPEAVEAELVDDCPDPDAT